MNYYNLIVNYKNLIFDKVQIETIINTSLSYYTIKEHSLEFKNNNYYLYSINNLLSINSEYIFTDSVENKSVGISFDNLKEINLFMNMSIGDVIFICNNNIIKFIATITSDYYYDNNYIVNNINLSLRRKIDYIFYFNATINNINFRSSIQRVCSKFNNQLLKNINFNSGYIYLMKLEDNTYKLSKSSKILPNMVKNILICVYIKKYIAIKEYALIQIFKKHFQTAYINNPYIYNGDSDKMIKIICSQCL